MTYCSGIVCLELRIYVSRGVGTEGGLIMASASRQKTDASVNVGQQSF